MKDDHNSRGMCTTSAVCQTISIVVLTVMDGMEPHMISKPWVGVELAWFGLVG
jgi:hypothetical protein